MTGGEPRPDSKNLQCVRIVRELPARGDENAADGQRCSSTAPASPAKYPETRPAANSRRRRRQKRSFISAFNFYENWARLRGAITKGRLRGPRLPAALDCDVPRPPHHRGSSTRRARACCSSAAPVPLPNYDEQDRRQRTRITMIDRRWTSCCRSSSQYPYQTDRRHRDRIRQGAVSGHRRCGDDPPRPRQSGGSW